VAADQGPEKKKKGPRGGVRHTPGRSHTPKSGPPKKKRFQRKAARKRLARQDELRTQWDIWDSLSPEVQRLRPELKPKLPRPNDES
jgi:hypothetical protein